VALLTCSADGVIQGANPGAEALFAVPVAELLGARVTEWLPFLPADAFAAEREPRVGDATLERVPSRPRVAYRAAPLYDRQGRARGGLVVVEDRSSAEALREAVQRAERLAVLGRLAAGLAHEIRNPLGAISGGVELVREGGAASAEDRELLATVTREVARLNDLVNDMLTFARPRAPERVPTDLAALAREVVALSGVRGTVRVRVRDDAEGEREVRATVDPGQVRQVLWNLLRNAEKVSPEDADVEVGVRETDAGVELSVCDRGPGVAPELRDRIFDAFYTEQTRGTGLGLAIVKQIVDEHRGAVSVRTREGGGSEFVVVLPRE
jgi:signal transduction histidine kinase